MIKQIRYAFALICLFIMSAVSLADIKVQVNNTQYLYEQNPRLSEVLAPLAFKEDWYWPNAKLFRKNSFLVEKMKRDTVFSLSNFAKASDLDLSSIISEIESWQLADRIQVPVDFEHARFSLEMNPRFENGDYLLLLSTRSQQIHFFGALKQEISLDYIDNACITDYLPNLQKLQYADTNYVYLLPNFSSEEDKLAIKAPIAYWNKQCVVPMPGSSIYVPLQENQIFKQSARINQQVLRLAQNRVFAL